MHTMDCTFYRLTLNFVSNDTIASLLIKLTSVYKYVGFFL
jgi:hypothetical protein